jgi:hypothetical protein
MRNRRLHSGQILLITLLVLSIATTIALSLVARSTTDLNISNQVEESSRAFSAAEAGIEQALKLQSVPNAVTLSGGVSYSVTKADIGGAIGALAFPKVTDVGGVETVWFVNHDDTGLPIFSARAYTNDGIDVCFNANGSPAVEVTIYYQKNGGSIETARSVYDADAVRAGTNNFTAVPANSGGCGDGTNTNLKQTIAFSSLGITANSDTLLLMRLRPLYANTQLAVSAPQILPLQGNKYDSCGKTGAGVSRCISVLQNYRTPSGVFDYAIYSGNGSFAPTE